jgi:hypothetical protein
MAAQLLKKKKRKKLLKKLSKLGKYVRKNPLKTGVGAAIGLGLGGGLAAYRAWKKSQRVINKNKEFQRPRRGRR